MEISKTEKKNYDSDNRGGSVLGSSFNLKMKSTLKKDAGEKKDQSITGMPITNDANHSLNISTNTQSFKNLKSGLNLNAPIFVPKVIAEDKSKSVRLFSDNTYASSMNERQFMNKVNKFESNSQNSFNAHESTGDLHDSQGGSRKFNNSSNSFRGGEVFCKSNNSINNEKTSNICNGVDINSLETIDEITFQKLSGKFYEIIVSPSTSKAIQNALKSTLANVLTKIFNEIKLTLPYLIVDQYGNYFCQKLFKILETTERIEFINCLKESIDFLGTDQVGSYALQNLISSLFNKDEKIMVISMVTKSAGNLIVDKLGVHVVERLVLCFDEELLTDLYEFLLTNFICFSNEANSLCVMKRLVCYHQNEKTKERLFTIMLKNIDILINNPYGNFTIQECLGRYQSEFVHPLLREIINDFHKYAMQKYSSNVIEKILELGDKVSHSAIAREMCAGNKVLDLIKNNFANFVVQKSLSIFQGEEKSALVNCIMKNIERIGEKKLIEKWRKIVQDSCENSLPFRERKLRKKSEPVTDSAAVRGKNPLGPAGIKPTKPKNDTIFSPEIGSSNYNNLFESFKNFNKFELRSFNNIPQQQYSNSLKLDYYYNTAKRSEFDDPIDKSDQFEY